MFFSTVVDSIPIYAWVYWVGEKLQVWVLWCSALPSSAQFVRAGAPTHLVLGGAGNNTLWRTQDIFLQLQSRTVPQAVNSRTRTNVISLSFLCPYCHSPFSLWPKKSSTKGHLARSGRWYLGFWCRLCNFASSLVLAALPEVCLYSYSVWYGAAQLLLPFPGALWRCFAMVLAMKIMLPTGFNKQTKYFLYFLFLLFPENNREMRKQESPSVNLGVFCEWVEGQINLCFQWTKHIQQRCNCKGHKGSEEHAFLLIIPPKSAEISLSEFIAIFCGKLRSLRWVLYNVCKHECGLMLPANLCAQWWYKTCCWCSLPRVQGPPQAGITNMHSFQKQRIMLSTSVPSGCIVTVNIVLL